MRYRTVHSPSTAEVYTVTIYMQVYCDFNLTLSPVFIWLHFQTLEKNKDGKIYMEFYCH